MTENIYDRLQRYRKSETESNEVTEELQAPAPPRFHTNELSFVRPTGYLDKTFHVLTQSETGPSPFSIVIGRSTVQHEDELEIVAQRLLTEVENSLPNFSLIEPLAETTIAGTDARSVEYRWRQQGRPVHQLQVLFMHKDELDNLLLLQITGTSSNPLGMTEEEKDSFRAFLASIELASNQQDSEQP
ncbi:DcrB-related protein [Pseudomonas sp. NBRC 100443]|uniref:DcrB-related protein n=1 Tax=Pseudomonas sp. NBRC 100443 TaxID=1113665 RepID=UPI0024A0AD97|nr:DcrB-related protein [Pseudomonas sp. NBRC 100443]GLU40002.1 hypothetical protein Pssp01_40950 [Pseudomonas sp. NBRC 100443]